MSVVSLARQLRRLEAASDPFDTEGIASMSNEQLWASMKKTIEEMGGKEAALAMMQAEPGTDPDSIKMVEDWPSSWPLA